MKAWLDLTIMGVFVIVVGLGLWKAGEFVYYISQHLRIEWIQ